MKVVEIGKDSLWVNLWEQLEPGTRIKVVLPGGLGYAGEFESPANWESLDESTRYYGVVVANDIKVSSWIPNDVIVGVELL